MRLSCSLTAGCSTRGGEARAAGCSAGRPLPYCRLPIALSLSCSIVCLAALGEFPEFLQMLNRELEEDVRNPDMYVLRAFFYKRSGQVWPCWSP